MKSILIKLCLVSAVLFSCKEESKSTTDKHSQEKETSISKEQTEIHKAVEIAKNKYLDKRHEYPDSNGQKLIIENGLPKGGLKYTSPSGQEYVYAVFWTQIINETDNPFELSIEFPKDSIDLPSSPDNYFMVVLPKYKMSFDHAPLFDYGLTNLDSILNPNIQNLHTLKQRILSKETSLFYVVTLFKKGVQGTMRAGVSLKEDQLFYTVNGKEFPCGSLILSN